MNGFQRYSIPIILTFFFVVVLPSFDKTPPTHIINHCKEFVWLKLKLYLLVKFILVSLLHLWFDLIRKREQCILHNKQFSDKKRSFWRYLWMYFLIFMLFYTYQTEKTTLFYILCILVDTIYKKILYNTSNALQQNSTPYSRDVTSVQCTTF